METVFLNQANARAYVAAISDPTERLLTEVAFSKAIGVWMRDPEQRERLLSQPIDVLAFVQAVHAFFRDRPVLEGILAGKITSLEDLDDRF